MSERLKIGTSSFAVSSGGDESLVVTDSISSDGTQSILDIDVYTPLPVSRNGVMAV